jgi:hypothetical protein
MRNTIIAIAAFAAILSSSQAADAALTPKEQITTAKDAAPGSGPKNNHASKLRVTVLKNGLADKTVVLPFASSAGADGREIVELRYSELPSDHGVRAFQDAFVIDGLKWKTSLKPDGFLHVEIAQYEKVGIVVIKGTAYPVVKGGCYTGDFGPFKQGGQEILQSENYRLVVEGE